MQFNELTHLDSGYGFRASRACCSGVEIDPSLGGRPTVSTKHPNPTHLCEAQCFSIECSRHLCESRAGAGISLNPLLRPSAPK